tara:strand:+ start:1030 stop:1356 length:327 start_codon:yes stop_codon:yes gene_type:complete
MATGARAAEGWSSRCQAADLLHFCLSRVRLDGSLHAADAALVGTLPRLVALLRAACVPLIAMTLPGAPPANADAGGLATGPPPLDPLGNDGGGRGGGDFSGVGPVRSC